MKFNHIFFLSLLSSILTTALSAWVVTCSADPSGAAPSRCYGAVIGDTNTRCDADGGYQAPLQGGRTSRRDPACRYCECQYWTSPSTSYVPSPATWSVLEMNSNDTLGEAQFKPEDEESFLILKMTSD